MIVIFLLTIFSNTSMLYSLQTFTERKLFQMKILVTGPNGFVGHKIVSEYARKFYQERARSSRSYNQVIPSPSLRGADQETIRRIVEESEADVIIHTAAISDIGQCQADPAASYHANVLIPVYLAEASKNRNLICPVKVSRMCRRIRSMKKPPSGRSRPESMPARTVSSGGKQP